MQWAPIGIVVAANVALFLGATVKAFTARARINRERDNDIRAAIAGYEAGEVIPALAAVVDEVDETRRAGESTADALFRADYGGLFSRAVEASIRSRSPRIRETALVHRYTTLGICLVAAHLTCFAALYNALTSGYNLPHTMVTVAFVVFAFALAGAVAAAILVARGENALARVIKDGKDAA